MTWLPVDYAASIIIDLCDVEAAEASAPRKIRSSDPDLVYHVLNPTRFHWTKDMLPALKAAGLEFETLPTDQWMERFRNADRDPQKNPPIKLLDWFESKYGHGATTGNKGPLVYLTEETGKDSPTINKVPDVTDKEYISKVISRLRNHWNV